jgi:hypothetical protein
MCAAVSLAVGEWDLGFNFCRCCCRGGHIRLMLMRAPIAAAVPVQVLIVP